MSRAALVFLFLLAVGCGKSTVTITGKLVSNGGVACLNPGFTSPSYQLNFANGAGAVVGTTVISRFTSDSNGCEVSGSYTITVPREDFYKVSVQGNTAPPVVISYADLAKQTFRLDISIS